MKVSVLALTGNAKVKITIYHVGCTVNGCSLWLVIPLVHVVSLLVPSHALMVRVTLLSVSEPAELTTGWKRINPSG